VCVCVCVCVCVKYEKKSVYEKKRTEKPRRHT